MKQSRKAIRRNVLLSGLLLLLTLPVAAQQLRLSQLLQYLQAPRDTFELGMLRQGFVCYRSQQSLWGITCLFAYQPTPLLTPSERAPALIQYNRTRLSSVVMYQVRSAGQYRLIQDDLARLGYHMASASAERCIFNRDNVVVSCQKTDIHNGLSGNYDGYSITLIRRY